MNRYRPGGPSTASATTLCQKCLQRGHYSYQCTAPHQDRPYTSRPSRTQQLLNPKLAPSITNIPPGLSPPKADTKAPLKSLASLARRKGHPDDDDDNADLPPRKRATSLSSHTTDSISTISTPRSRSPAPASRGYGAGRRDSRARSRSPNDSSRRARDRNADIRPRETGRPASDDTRGARQRSLSPYSRRVALGRG